jgi:predicted PurR-regulated permease PerM
MNTQRGPLKIEITHKSILFTFAVFIAFWLLGAIWDIILAVFIAVLIATAIHPMVKFFERYRIPRELSAFVILALTFVGLISLIVSTVPLFVGQVSLFLSRLPGLIEQFPWLEIEVSSVASPLASLSGNVVRLALNTFSASIFLITTLFISFYLIIERHKLDDYLSVLFGDGKKEIEEVILKIETKLGHWLRGQLFLMVVVGVMTYVGLEIIGLDYVLPLAIIAAVFEAVPNIGPIISAVPAVIVGFAMSPLHGLLTLLLYLVVQQLENNLIVPQVMRKQVGLHPVVTMVTLLIGYRLGGVLLAVLSLPIVLTAQTILTAVYRRRFAV